MNLIKIENKEKWNKFVESISPNRFSQSWEWGEICEERGLKIKRWGLESKGEFFGIASMWEGSLFLGKRYWYCPGGPLIKKGYEEEFFKLIKEELDNNIFFLRLEPTSEIKLSGFEIEKSINIQPKETMLLDLSQGEDELLGKMHQKTRYNIRLASKKGLEIRKGGEKDFEDWWKIMEETGGRDKFKTHNKDYYKNMIDFKERKESDFRISLYLVYYKNKVIAGNIVSFFGDTVTYVHGASSYEYRKVMAPYLLQWKVIKKAKEKGYKYYDLYGIDEEKWPGITRFKKGFGGDEVKYPGTYDLILNRKWYNVYKFLRKIRRKI